MSFMEAVHDLIEEAKLRTLYWTICIFVLCYFISHTSKSMWMNIPISLLLVSALRILSSKVEFRWRVQLVGQPTYLSHLEKKQLSVNDSRLSTSPPPPKWMRKISSPVVEAAVHEFINKLLQDFVVDLWYSDITPDREAPELMRSIIMDVLGEISGRVKELNLVDLLTRAVVDLIGDHLDLYRRNQLAIGRDVMNRLSIEERDERLKHHLMDSKELHPALISPECEYKVLQQLIGGVLSVVLRPREAQCPLARCIARELVASLVMQPVMNLACPAYINELIESLFLAAKGGGPKVPSNMQSDAVGHQHDYSAAEGVQNGESTLRTHASSDIQGIEKVFSKANSDTEQPMDATGTLIPHAFHSNSLQQHSADWARGLNAATQRRTEVLMPENLENMWSRGRNYKKSAHKSVKAEVQARSKRGSVINSSTPTPISREYMLMNRPQNLAGMEEKSVVRLTLSSEDLNRELPFESAAALIASGSKPRLRRSNSTSSLKVYPSVDIAFSGEGEGSIISEFYDPNVRIDKENGVKGTSDMVLPSEALHAPKLKCGVRGAYFEKIGSKSFAVYSIVVTDAENNTWSVKRRYRNFERLHRQLKDIPNYTLHLPPKRIFSSSTEDSFVHQRCIQLNRYLQDLLSVANVAEQHEVWDFFSASSKNYSFGKSSSVMKTLAVNVDDAVDDIVRQFKEVSDGLVRKVVGSSHFEASSSMSGRNMSWHSDDIRKHILGQSTTDTANSFSDNGEGGNAKNHVLGEFGYSAEANGWHSDNELNSRSFPPRVIKSNEVKSIDLKKSRAMDLESELFGQLEDPIGVPPEWTPPNVSVPILNLVDKLFQLKRRGWLRRQVFWISKQILQLVMEDAIDDFLLRQISWLRREEIIAQGVRWVQDVLWPNGTFFLRLVNAQTGMDGGQHIQGACQATGSAVKQGSSLGSFEAQLEASRRASDIKKIIFDGAPTTLVSLIGSKQYKRCANDIYYFLQSTVCVKQLAYGILELALISVFPELRELLIDVHKKTRAHL